MKKITSLALAALLAMSMAACGSSSAPETVPTTSETTEATTTVITTETPTETTEASTETTEAIEENTFEEIVLVDNEDLTFKITAVENDDLWGYTLKVFLENKTDKELMFTLDNTSINGFMCDPFWAETVAAGKKSNTTISWFESEFEANGIETVEQIDFTLRVYDNGDWMADDILNEEFTVNP